MINKNFWSRIAEHWCKADDGIEVPDDKELEAQKVADISGDDLDLFCSIPNEEIDDILSDLGLDF